MTETPDLFRAMPAPPEGHDPAPWFARRLADHRHPIDLSLVHTDLSRRELIRKAIMDAGLDYAIIGRAPNGRAETYQAAFARCYREPLVPITRKTSRRSAT